MNSLAKKWFLDNKITFLNHGSFGACPKEVLSFQNRIQRLLEREPVYFMTEIYESYLNESRTELAKLINADEEGIVFLTNATTAVNTVLNSIPFRAGDEIVITNHEYNACKNAVMFYAGNKHLKVRIAQVPFPLRNSQEVIDAIGKVITKKTRFILIDHITSATALVFPAEEIVRRFSDKNIDIMIDGAHSVGQIPLNLKSSGAHYYTSNCHKWLFAPKGAAFLYVREDRRQNINPLVISHGYNSERRDKSRFHLLFDWTGTQDFSPFICVKKGIEFAKRIKGSLRNLIRENHIKVIEGRNIILDALNQKKPAPDDMLGSMSSIILPEKFIKFGNTGRNNKIHLQNILFKKYRIEVPVIRFSEEELLLRISAQVYNSVSDYEYLAESLLKILSRR